MKLNLSTFANLSSENVSQREIPKTDRVMSHTRIQSDPNHITAAIQKVKNRMKLYKIDKAQKFYNTKIKTFDQMSTFINAKEAIEECNPFRIQKRISTYRSIPTHKYDSVYDRIKEEDELEKNRESSDELYSNSNSDSLDNLHDESHSMSNNSNSMYTTAYLSLKSKINDRVKISKKEKIENDPLYKRILSLNKDVDGKIISIQETINEQNPIESDILTAEMILKLMKRENKRESDRDYTKYLKAQTKLIQRHKSRIKFSSPPKDSEEIGLSQLNQEHLKIQKKFEKDSRNIIQIIKKTAKKILNKKTTFGPLLPKGSVFNQLNDEDYIKKLPMKVQHMMFARISEEMQIRNKKEQSAFKPIPIQEEMRNSRIKKEFNGSQNFLMSLEEEYYNNLPSINSARDTTLRDDSRDFKSATTIMKSEKERERMDTMITLFKVSFKN